MVEALIMGAALRPRPIFVKAIPWSFRGAREAGEPGISNFPDAQLRIWGLVLRTIPE